VLQGCAKKIQVQLLLTDLALQLRNPLPGRRQAIRRLPSGGSRRAHRAATPDRWPGKFDAAAPPASYARRHFSNISRRMPSSAATPSIVGAASSRAIAESLNSRVHHVRRFATPVLLSEQ
jgi:hypothetical protein